MNLITPIKHKDGTETVTLFGTVVDVTNKDSFTLFKTDYKVIRADKTTKADTKSSKTKKAATKDVEATNETN